MPFSDFSVTRIFSTGSYSLWGTQSMREWSLMPGGKSSTGGSISKFRTSKESSACSWYFAYFSAVKLILLWLVGPGIQLKVYFFTYATSGASTEWNTLVRFDASVRLGLLETLRAEDTGLLKVSFVVAHCNEAHNDSGALGHLGAICIER